MILISVIIIFLIALLLWILLMPVTLMIDTGCDRYELNQKGIFKVSFHPGEISRIRIRVMGISVRMRGPKRAAKNVEQKPSSMPRSRSLHAWMILLKGVYRSINVRRLIATVDIDDVVLNAQLIPVLLMASRGRIDLSTNFQKRYFLHAVIQLRLNKLLWPVIRFFTKK